MTIQNPPPTLDSDSSKKHFSKAMRELVAKCLVKDPAKRPTAAQVGWRRRWGWGCRGAATRRHAQAAQVHPPLPAWLPAPALPVHVQRCCAGVGVSLLQTPSTTFL
jgi:serine/threonine protein kinase